jgi:hypothetical protein
MLLDLYRRSQQVADRLRNRALFPTVPPSLPDAVPGGLGEPRPPAMPDPRVGGPNSLKYLQLITSVWLRFVISLVGL